VLRGDPVVFAGDQVGQVGQRQVPGALQQPHGGALYPAAVGVLQHDPGVEAATANGRGALAQLEQQHPGVLAGGAGVFQALPAELTQHRHRVHRFPPPEQRGDGADDVAVLRDGEVLLGQAGQQRPGPVRGGLQRTAQHRRLRQGLAELDQAGRWPQLLECLGAGGAATAAARRAAEGGELRSASHLMLRVF